MRSRKNGGPRAAARGAVAVTTLGAIVAVLVAGGAGAGTGMESGAPAGPGAGSGPIRPQPRMGAPLLDLTPEEQTRFDVGRDLFKTPLLAEEGLGPIFNRRFCGACHIHPTTGGTGTLVVTRFGREEDGVFDPLEEYGGSLLQMLANDDACLEEIPAEANVIINRVVNGAFGYGLVEAIPDEAILALEQEPPGISGRGHVVQPLEDPGVDRVGRFGWKAQVATVLTFSADAARNEMGFTNRLVPTEPDPNGERAPHLEDCDTVTDPEDGPDGEGFEFIDRVTDFQRFLAPPPQTPRSGMAGEALFMAVGCGTCHHPSHTTADDPELEPVLRNRVIRPYSDFLLHDMGEAADGIAQHDATVDELRTPPLWGLRTRKRMWHDGRFDQKLTFEERVTLAIEEHGAAGCEAEEAGVMDAWAALTDDERADVLRFLSSLGRREFDANADEAVLLDDFIAFMACFTGPGEFYTPEDECSVSDIDQDGDVDDDDYLSFLLAYTGPRDDCNENGVLDLDDIVYGTSSDENRNGVPDECETCLADLDGDGEVGTADLLAVLAAWGPCPGEKCAEDFDRSGQIDTADLLVVLNSWGPCE